MTTHEPTVYRKDGEPFWVDLDISPVWDPARRLTHWVAVGRDVTLDELREPDTLAGFRRAFEDAGVVKTDAEWEQAFAESMVGQGDVFGKYADRLIHHPNVSASEIGRAHV